MAGLASINIKFFADLKQFSTEMQTANRQMVAQGKQLQEYGRNMSMYFTAPILLAAGAAVHFASDMEESSNKVDVAFKDSQDVVRDFAKTTLENFGIAEGSALDMASLFGDMATSMGIVRPEAAKMSTSLVGLAGDLASFKNIGIEQATTALNGVFTGETESLKMLGIVMTEANLAQFALSRGITKSIKDFTQAEKVQLRYAYVMQQTANAQGDFARTGGGFANQARVLQEGLKTLAAEMGQSLLPIATKLVHVLNEAVQWFRELSPAAKNTITVVAGLAAATGPLLFGLGSVMKMAVDLRTSFVDLSPAMQKNISTFAAVAGVLGVLYLSYKLFRGETYQMVSAQKTVADVSLQAKKSIAGEVGGLNELLKSAKSEILSKKEKQAAISKLNADYDIYNGKITLENINTKEVTESVNNYVKSLENKALAQAAQAKRQDLFAQRIEVENKALGENKNIMDDVLGVLYKKLGIDTTGVDIKNREELERYIESLHTTAEGADALRKAYAPYLAIKDKELKNLDAQIGALKKYGEAQGVVADATVTSTAAQAKTIDFYNEQISVLEKMRTGSATTSDQVQGFDEKIAALREKIAKLENKRVTVTTVLETVRAGDDTLKAPSFSYGANDGRIKELQKERDAFLDIQKNYEEGTVVYENLAKRINDLDVAIKFNIDPVSLGQFQTVLPKTLTDAEVRFKLFSENMKQMSADFSASVTQSLKNFSADAVATFAEFVGQMAMGKASIGNVFVSLGGLIADFITNVGKSLIAVGVAGIAFETSLSNPVSALVAGAVVVAAGAAFKAVLGQFSGSYAEGGIIPGSSSSGDRLFARVNSGEMILNKRQQNNIMNMINPAATAEGMMVQFMGNFEISGDSLRLVLARNNEKNNRFGS